MPRGRKKRVNLTLDERIVIAEQEIRELEVQLKAKKAEFMDLKKQKDEEELRRLYAAVEESGKSLDEVISWIKNS